MADKVGMMRPTWSDGIIDGVIATEDPKAIAQALANSPRFLEAIKRGLAFTPKPGTVGASRTQHVRQAIVEELQAV
jgi:hypothetical protein